MSQLEVVRVGPDGEAVEGWSFWWTAGTVTITDDDRWFLDGDDLGARLALDTLGGAPENKYRVLGRGRDVAASIGCGVRAVPHVLHELDGPPWDHRRVHARPGPRRQDGSPSLTEPDLPLARWLVERLTGPAENRRRLGPAASGGSPDRGTWDWLAGLPLMADPHLAASVAGCKLGGAESGTPRETLAGNPATAPEVLDRLARSKSSHVQCAVAGNPSYPVAHTPRWLKYPVVVARIAQRTDLDPVIAGACLDAADRCGPTGSSTAFQIRRNLAGNPAAPVSALRRVAAWDEVASVLAKNPAAPADLLERLAATTVATAVAGNPSAPEGLLAGLAHHPDADVRAAANRNPAAPPTGTLDMGELLDVAAERPARNQGAVAALLHAATPGEQVAAARFAVDHSLHALLGEMASGAEEGTLDLAAVEHLARHAPEAWARRAVWALWQHHPDTLARIAADRDTP